jgi:uncharacterized protein (DUF362 family)
MGTAFVCSASFFSAANPFLPDTRKTKVIVARGNDYQQLFDHALSELGGLSSFVKEGSLVALKPDISRDALPGEGLTTHPLLVKHITKQCYKNKCKAVYVFDHCIDEWTKCYRNSGIERIAKDAAAKVLPGNQELFFREQDIPGAAVLTRARIHNALSNGSLLIDVPVLKTDPETTISGGLKNLTGCILDQNVYRQAGANRCIAEFLYYKKPDLTVIDAGNLLSTVSGKSEEHVVIISADVVAADAVACRLTGIDPLTVEHLKIAAELGLGVLSENEIEVKNIFV